jgi:signal transduction histidine kinase
MWTSIWTQPRAAHPPRRVWRDWGLVAAIASTAVVEFAVRWGDMVSRPVAAVEILVLATLMLWRRTHPLTVIALGFGLVIAVDLISLLAGAGGQVSPSTMAYLLVLPYSLVRWASGPEAILGLVFPIVAALVGLLVEPAPLRDTLVGFVILALPVVVGAEVRAVTSSRARELDQVRLKERQELARELHDTVAHHVSAMVVRAQAGRVLGAGNPKEAVEALRVIEAEGSRTLAEMRAMVGALRDLDEAELRPQHGLRDLIGLARGSGDLPRIEVALSGDPDVVGPAVGAAVYRIAQESVTNAVRHARRASRVLVEATVEANGVRLTIADDGDVVSPGRVDAALGPGYGLAGMTERATLLGGTLEAGPGPDRGWLVTAVLPQLGGTS